MLPSARPIWIGKHAAYRVIDTVPWRALVYDRTIGLGFQVLGFRHLS